MKATVQIIEATPDDAPAIADIHLSARAAAMPYLRRMHTDDETRGWLIGCVGDRQRAWWVARQSGSVVGYMLIDGEDLDHLYVRPEAQGRGIGSALLRKVQSLSPQRVALVTFQRNARARVFYEKHGFRAVRFTDGENEESEPDVHYVWEGAARMQLVPIAPAQVSTSSADTQLVPALVADAGDQASWRFIEFFTVNIRNPNTRRAYARACTRFFAWCEASGLTLTTIRPFDVAAWVEGLQAEHSAPGVKQQLAAVRMLFDWLITGQVVPTNPAAAVRGPKHVVKTGSTPVLEGDEWRRLMDSIPTTTLRDLRDRALIATLTYSFARIGAALKMKVEDLRPRNAGWTIRLHEKGGKQHAMPCHHALAEALHAYLATAGIADDRKGWLFRTASGHTGTLLSEKPMGQTDAWRMIRKHASAAGIMAPIGNHSFRATGITAYLTSGGALEHAQTMAAHESPRTTKLYDRTQERLTQNEVERIRL